MSATPLTRPIRAVQFRPDLFTTVSDSLRERLANSGGSVQAWEDPPGAVHPPHDHPYAHRVLCVDGWIEFTVESRVHHLTEGDALDLPAGVTHSAETRPGGPTRYWLIRPPGS